MNYKTTSNYFYNTICIEVSGEKAKTKINNHLEYYKTTIDFEKYKDKYYLSHILNHIEYCSNLIKEVEQHKSVIIPSSNYWGLCK